MKHSIRAALALGLSLALLALTACSSSSSSAPASSDAGSEPISSLAPSPSSEPETSSSQEESSALVTASSEATAPETKPEAVETTGGAVAELTGVVTGEITLAVPGISGYRAGAADERDALMKQLSALGPGLVSLVVIGDPLSGYPDQTLLSDEDAKALIGMIAALPTPGVYETLSNPTTGGFLWTLYLEAGDQVISLSDDGFWLTASIKGNPQSLVFDSRPCKATSDKLDAFLQERISAAQGNVLTLS